MSNCNVNSNRGLKRRLEYSFPANSMTPRRPLLQVMDLGIHEFVGLRSTNMCSSIRPNAASKANFLRISRSINNSISNERRLCRNTRRSIFLFPRDKSAEEAMGHLSSPKLKCGSREVDRKVHHQPEAGANKDNARPHPRMPHVIPRHHHAKVHLRLQA